MSDYEYIDPSGAVVVHCKGKYEGAQWSGSLEFVRLWFRQAVTCLKVDIESAS